MDRRKFILLSTGAVAAAGATWYLLHLDGRHERFLATPQAYPLIWDEATVSQIGTAYRADVPTENDSEKLSGLLGEITGDDQQDAAALQAAIQEDYAAGRTFVLAGWIVAVTEARQCALYSLIHAY
jgi:hypothetical protein